MARLGYPLFLLMLASVLGLAIFSWGKGHPQDPPWTPLSLADPVGPFPDFSYAPRAEVSCSVAVGLFLWERQVVQPAALRYFGQRLKRIETFGSYACRAVRGRGEERWSEHARANAIDIAGFRLADGRRIGIASDWSRQHEESAFLREVRTGRAACFPPHCRRTTIACIAIIFIWITQCGAVGASVADFSPVNKFAL